MKNREIGQKFVGDMRFGDVQGGPLPFITRFITPISRVITPGKPIYKAIYRGYNSIYKW